MSVWALCVKLRIWLLAEGAKKRFLILAIPLRGTETVEISWKAYNTKCGDVYYKDISFFILNILNFTVPLSDFFVFLINQLLTFILKKSTPASEVLVFKPKTYKNICNLHLENLLLRKILMDI